jgi:hypothetical protein
MLKDRIGEVWAIDETIQWMGTAPGGRPLETGRVLLSNKAERTGVHWDGSKSSTSGSRAENQQVSQVGKTKSLMERIREFAKHPR